MPTAPYSAELLEAIRTGAWQEPELDLSSQELDDKAIQELVRALATNPFIRFPSSLTARYMD